MSHTPEQLARQEIDRQLAECGWLVQHHVSMNVCDGLELNMHSAESGSRSTILTLRSGENACRDAEHQVGVLP